MHTLLVQYSESETIHVPNRFARLIQGEPYAVQPLAWEGSKMLSHTGYDLDDDEIAQLPVGLVAHGVFVYDVPLSDLGLAKVELPMRNRVVLESVKEDEHESVSVDEKASDVSGEPADGRIASDSARDEADLQRASEVRQRGRIRSG